MLHKNAIIMSLFSCTVNSPIRAQCAQTENACALIWKAQVKTFPTIYDNPYFALYSHVIYRWKAPELNLQNLKTGGEPLLGVHPYWRIYGNSFPDGIKLTFLYNSILFKLNLSIHIMRHSLPVHMFKSSFRCTLIGIVYMLNYIPCTMN